MTETHKEISERQKEYWKKNISIIRNLLILWASVSFVPVVFFANALHNVKFFGVPVSYWFAHQGSMIVFVGLIFYYAWRMDKLDKEYNVDEANKVTENKDKGVSA